MSASSTTAFDESTESMALLGSHEQIPDPTTADATDALTHRSSYVSQRLEVVLSQCQSDSEIDREMLDDFEIHRRSADTYMNQYLDCLQQVHEERSGHVYEIDDFDDVASQAPDLSAVTVTREEWRLKISRDSLARDLLAMHETLEFLKTRAAPLPGKSALISTLGVYLAGISCYGKVIRDHYGKATRTYFGKAIRAFFTKMFDVISYYLPEICISPRKIPIEKYQGEIEALHRRLNKGEVDERNRGDLRRMPFGW